MIPNIDTETIFKGVWAGGEHRDQKVPRTDGRFEPHLFYVLEK
jgi:hypothetical protein